MSVGAPTHIVRQKRALTLGSLRSSGRRNGAVVLVRSCRYAREFCRPGTETRALRAIRAVASLGIAIWTFSREYQGALILYLDRAGRNTYGSSGALTHCAVPNPGQQGPTSAPDPIRPTHHRERPRWSLVCCLHPWSGVRGASRRPRAASAARRTGQRRCRQRHVARTTVAARREQPEYQARARPPTASPRLSAGHGLRSPPSIDT